MRLTRCPACRALVLEQAQTCRCGTDLMAVRSELQRLMTPSNVIPLEPFRKLTPKHRRTLSQAYRCAQE